MNSSASSPQSWFHRPLPGIVVTVVLIGSIMALDYATGPAANLSILYFIPITYAAWAFGRPAALACAFVADIPHYADQLGLASAGHHSSLTATVNIVVRLLVYAFVAEVTYRLVASRAESGRAARRLTVANDDLKRTYDRLDEDLDAAGMLQATYLLPAPINVPGCSIGVSVRYAGRIGGDFADAGSINGRVYACVADIAGKGTPAALFTALLKHLLNDAIRRDYRGAEVVNRVHSSLCQTLPPEKFVTLFYAEVDPGTGTVEYVNAGHPEGLLYRARTGAIEAVPPNTPLLGFCDLPVSACSSSLRLDDGDVLMLYSDGAVESKTLDGGRLGDETIRRLLERHAGEEAQEMADRVASEIEAMTDPARRDDLAILCVKATNPAT